jgi:hypothetical protein
MKHALKAMLIAGAVGAGALLTAPTASAQYRESSVAIYIDLGDVSIAYRNGYYDHDRRWHRWRSDRERAYFSRRYRSHYRDYEYRHDRHDRGRHRGHRRNRDWDD